ncbi:MAG: gamma-glutamylcyclotransferase [Planctomycetaceae bacterium]|nr:gamma-glutamylcyclotransferase [Planctomycetaceae bacterium]
MKKDLLPPKPVNLFVYGSLREPSIFESVCGYSFSLKPSESRPWNVLRAELAMLPNYRRVSPDNVYFYAIPDVNAKVQGFIIYDVPNSAMAVIDKYEGKFYEREAVTLRTAAGPAEAQAYLASPKNMRKRFGDRFHVNLIHELWLRKRIEKFFDMNTRPGEKSMDADIERRARRELLGTTERDLVVSHLGQDAVSDFYLETELNRPTPSIRHLVNTPEIQPYVENYIGLLIKQSLLNHFESMIYARFRFELDQLCTSSRYYNHVLSLLIALRMINSNRQALELILRRGIETMPPKDGFDLIDYVKYGVSAAENAFDPRVVQGNLQSIRQNLQPGLVPMGAEVELSNLGYRAIHKNIANQDPVFDGFHYFSDFALDVLSWKMGGYVDDHSGESSHGSRGFLELAPGRLNTLGEVSKPVTADPWVLNQLINEIVSFFPVNPHSLHLSFQLRRTQVGKQTVLPLSFAKCLFVMAGGTQYSENGRLWISRMENEEIQRKDFGDELMFARTSKRKPRMSPDPMDVQPSKYPVFVHQYKFMRLERRASYEPLILALKGIQLSINPGDYLTAAQLEASARLRRDYDELKAWAANPAPIARNTKAKFMDTIYDGLMHEAHNKPYHKLHYIDWAMAAIDLQITLFNKHVEASGKQKMP